MGSKAKTEETAVVRRTVESVYTAEELADRADLFGVRREIAVVALKKAGKKAATFQEAKAIIERFKKEVRK